MLRCNVSAPWETMDGDWEAGPLYSGTSAALINSVEPVSQLAALAAFYREHGHFVVTNGPYRLNSRARSR